MEHHFDTELDVLKQKLLTMASHAETAVNQALQALTQRDRDLALRVKEDDRIIDQFEVEIDEQVIQGAAGQQFAARHHGDENFPEPRTHRR